MQEVMVAKAELLEKLRDNRVKHKEDYDKALKKYLNKLHDELQDRLTYLEHGKIPDQKIDLPKPTDHTKQYDKIIAMVEMSVDDSIKLYPDEFAMYVMDDWGWKQSFAVTNSFYGVN